MLEIDLIIDAFQNGEWHKSNKIFEECNLSEVKVKKILNFLAEYGFIEISGRQMKVSKSLQRFLEETQL